MGSPSAILYFILKNLCVICIKYGAVGESSVVPCGGRRWKNLSKLYPFWTYYPNLDDLIAFLSQLDVFSQLDYLRIIIILLFSI